MQNCAHSIHTIWHPTPKVWWVCRIWFPPLCCRDLTFPLGGEEVGDNRFLLWAAADFPHPPPHSAAGESFLLSLTSTVQHGTALLYIRKFCIGKCTSTNGCAKTCVYTTVQCTLCLYCTLYSVQYTIEER